MNIKLNNIASDGGAGKVDTSSVSTSLKPQVPKTPSAADLAINFDVAQLPPLSSDEGGPATTEQIKGTEIKKDDTSIKAPTTDTKLPTEEKPIVTKVEEKKDEKGTKVEDSLAALIKPPKGKEKIVVQPSKSDDPFDYTGHDEEEIGILKPIALNARAKVSKALKDAKESKNATWYQHPQAYAFTPEWNKASEDVTFARKEASIYEALLEQVKLNKPIKMLKAFDEKGEPIFTDEDYQPSAALEERLRSAMNNTHGVAQKIQNDMRAYANNHVNRVQNDRTIIQAENARKFPWVANPEMLEHEVEVYQADGTVKDVSIKQLKQEWLKLWPSYLQNDLAVDVTANMLIGMIIRDNRIRALESASKTTQVKKEEANLVEPSSASRPVAPARQVNGVSTFSTEGAPEGI